MLLTNELGMKPKLGKRRSKIGLTRVNCLCLVEH